MISARSKARSARSERDETSNRHRRTLASPDAVDRAGDRAKASRHLCVARDVRLAESAPASQLRKRSPLPLADPALPLRPVGTTSAVRRTMTRRPRAGSRTSATERSRSNAMRGASVMRFPRRDRGQGSHCSRAYQSAVDKKPPEGLFGEARVVEPSLSYFPARGLDPAAFPDLSRAVRFAPRCWHAASKAETPALIVALTDEARQVRAIQRLYLTADCRAKVCKPMSLGKISGLAIKLGPLTDTLYVAEGLEDAMTAQQASEGKSSAWAAAGSSNMQNLVVPAVVTTVVFLGQNDKDDPGQHDKTFEQNLAKAAPKLMREGKAVRVAWPPAGVKDINDLVKGRTGPALATGYADVKRMIDAAEEVLPADDDHTAAGPMQGSQANVLIELALNDCELFHDPEGECYASFSRPA